MAGDTVTTGGLVVAGTGCYYAGTGVTFYMEDPNGGPFSGIMAYNPPERGIPGAHSRRFDSLHGPGE